MEKVKNFSTIKEGVLLRATAKGGSYKKYWAVIGTASLYLFKSAKDTKEAVAISLGTGGLSITSDSTSKAPYGFEMTIKDTNPETTHYLACTTTTERDEWIDALSPPDLNSSRDRIKIEDGNDSDSSEEEDGSSNRVSMNSSFKREKLLLAYRFMKGKLLEQAAPRTIFLPQDEVMHRFGYEIAIQKLERAFESLDTLYFKDCQYGGDFAQDLVNFLFCHERFHTIVFENTGKGGACDALPSACVSLLPLCVRSLSFLGSLSARGLQTLPTALMENSPGLIYLTLQRAPLKHELEPFIQAISASAIEHLHLHECEIGDAGLALILPYLLTNPRIRTLSLTQAGLTKACRDQLKSLLSSAGGLATLNLSGNKLCEALDGVFSTLAKPDHTLKKLIVSDTRMTSSAIFELCKVLQENQTLRILDISDNRLKDDNAAKILCVAIKQNTTLCTLNYQNAFRNLGTDEIDLIEAQLKDNKKTLLANAMGIQERRHRGKLQVIEENIESQKLLGSLLHVDVDLLCLENNASDTFRQIKDAVDTLWSKGSVPKPANGVEYGLGALQQQEARYTLGTNLDLIHAILTFFHIAAELAHERKGPEPDPNALDSKTGFMHKRGGKMKNWKHRWFVLSGKAVHYFVSDQKTHYKGTISLLEAQVHVAGGGVTPYSFVVATPARDYFLSCESEEERTSWMESIAAASSRQSRRYSMHDFSRLKYQMKEFEKLYLSNTRHQDPHSHWVLQWWIPLFLEIILRFYGERDDRHFSALSEFLVNKTTLALYLLTGDYLYDRIFVRNFEGLIRVSYCASMPKQYLSERLERIQEVLVKGTEYSRDAAMPKLADLHALWSQKSAREPLLTIPQCKNSHKLAINQPGKFTNALLDLEEFSGILSPLLDGSSDDFLSMLFHLRKRGGIGPPQPGTDQSHSVLRHRFEYFSDKSTQTPCPLSQDLPECSARTSFRPLIFPPPAFFTETSGDMPSDLFYYLQEFQLVSSVFVLWALYKDLRSVPVSFDDVLLYNRWTEYRSCAEELISHLAMCAIEGYDRDDALVLRAFEILVASTSSLLISSMHSLLSCPDSVE